MTGTREHVDGRTGVGDELTVVAARERERSLFDRTRCEPDVGEAALNELVELSAVASHAQARAIDYPSARTKASASAIS